MYSYTVYATDTKFLAPITSLRFREHRTSAHALTATDNVSCQRSDRRVTTTSRRAKQTFPETTLDTIVIFDQSILINVLRQIFVCTAITLFTLRSDPSVGILRNAWRRGMAIIMCDVVRRFESVMNANKS